MSLLVVRAAVAAERTALISHEEQCSRAGDSACVLMTERRESGKTMHIRIMWSCSLHTPQRIGAAERRALSSDAEEREREVAWQHRMLQLAAGRQDRGRHDGGWERASDREGSGRLRRAGCSD